VTSSLSEKPHGVQPWIMASRPKTLPAAVAPVLVGAALAIQAHVFDLWAVLAALFAALMLQIGANYANDLFDFRRGADSEGRLGPTRVTTTGLLTPRQVAVGMWISFGLASLAGLYLIYLGGWPILLVGVLSILAAIAYTAGPLPLGYHGLGDLAVFLFFGLIAVVGTFYVQAKYLTWVTIVAAVPMGALITAILVVNNIRDADTDRQAGKHTLAVLLGRRGARIEFLSLILIAYITPLVLWLGFGMRFWVLLPILTIPLALRLIRAVAGARWLLSPLARMETVLRGTTSFFSDEKLAAATPTLGPALNNTLAGTAQLAVWFGLALALGLVL
jgi:1,4-dihydroxy-2-naphthoate polyprenyltransferase